MVGASGRIRTCDTWYRKPVLYPLSYGGMLSARWTGLRSALTLQPGEGGAESGTTTRCRWTSDTGPVRPWISMRGVRRAADRVAG